MIPLRDENPTRSTPYITYLLITVNIAIFLFQTFGGGMFETRAGLAGPLAGWTMVPAEVTSGLDYRINGPTLQPFFLTILTSMFLHGGWLHLGGNMLFLAIFGNNIEDVLGSVKYLFFYVVCGVAAAATQILSMPNSPIPTLGASGAIAGVLGAYLVLFPKARVLTLVFLGFLFTWIRVPAWLLLGFWIVTQFFSQWTQSLKTEMMSADQGGVAYFAHIGGFIAGMILIKVLGGRPPRVPYEPFRPAQPNYRLIRR